MTLWTETKKIVLIFYTYSIGKTFTTMINFNVMQETVNTIIIPLTNAQIIIVIEAKTLRIIIFTNMMIVENIRNLRRII
jgi:hypothetical protein